MSGYSKDDFARAGDPKGAANKMKVSKKNLIIISVIGVLGLGMLVASFLSSGSIF